MKKTWIQVLKFGLFSASAGLVQVGSFTLLNELLHWVYRGAYLTALVLSILWNFTLNRKFTFSGSNNAAKAMALVFLYYLVFTPLSTWGGSALTHAGFNEYLVLAITMLLNFVTEYLYQKRVVYGEKTNGCG